MNTNLGKYVMVFILCATIVANSGVAYVYSLQSPSIINLKDGIDNLNQQKIQIENTLSDIEKQIISRKKAATTELITKEIIPTQLPEMSSTWETYTSNDFQFSLRHPKDGIVTDLLEKATEKGYPLPPGRPLFQIIHSPTIQVELGPIPTPKAKEYMVEIIVKDAPPISQDSSFCSFSQSGTPAEKIIIDGVKGETSLNGSSCFFLEEKNMLLEIKVYLERNSDKVLANKILDSIRFTNSL